MVQSIREERRTLIEAINELYPPNSQYWEVKRIAWSLCYQIGPIPPEDYPGGWSNQTLQNYYEACVRRSEQE